MSEFPIFKRFLVTDLFHGAKYSDTGEWIPCDKELPKGKSGIYKVRLENGDEVKSYYYEDKLYSMMKHFKDKSSYWYKYDTKKPLYDVIQWAKPSKLPAEVALSASEPAE